MSGYWEMDFLGAAPTANENQSNSFTPPSTSVVGDRLPSITAGRSPAAKPGACGLPTRRASRTRQEWIPATIEGQYVVGYDFARLATIRLTKNFHNKAWFGALVGKPGNAEPVVAYFACRRLRIRQRPTVRCGTAPRNCAGSNLRPRSPTALATDFMPDVRRQAGIRARLGTLRSQGLDARIPRQDPRQPTALRLRRLTTTRLSAAASASTASCPSFPRRLTSSCRPATDKASAVTPIPLTST